MTCSVDAIINLIKKKARLFNTMRSVTENYPLTVPFISSAVAWLSSFKYAQNCVGKYVFLGVQTTGKKS